MENLDLSYMSISEIEAIYGRFIAFQEQERRELLGISYEYDEGK